MNVFLLQLAKFFLFTLNIFFVVYYADLKTGFHIDELYSFAHSNSTQGAFLSENIDSFFLDTNHELQNKWIDGRDFHDYLTVQEYEKFGYSHIWENMAKDVHPPFYYILLHTVCSFFPDMFTKWHGAFLNIILWVLTLYMLSKLSGLFFADKKIALIPVICYAFSQIGFDTVIYIRMYLLQTLLTISLIYETILLLNENKLNKCNIFLIFLYSFLGIFTHYNAIVFSFLVASTTCFVLLLRKNWKLLFAYSCAMLLSVGLLFILFPEATYAIFSSQRSEDIAHVSWDFFLFIKAFFVFYNSSIYVLFNTQATLVKYFVGILFFVFLFVNRNKFLAHKLFYFLFFIVLSMGTWLVFYMPNMNQFTYRYFMLLFPLLIIVIFYVLYSVLKNLNVSPKIIFVVFFVFAFISSINTYFNKNSPYFNLRNDELTEDFIESTKGKKIFFLTPYLWMLFENSHYFMDAQKVYISLEHCNLELKEILMKNKDAYFMYFNKDGSDCINCYPLEKADICDEFKNNLVFIYTVRIGERFYDVYKIR